MTQESFRPVPDRGASSEIGKRNVPVSSPTEIEIKLQLPSTNDARLRRIPLLRRASTSKQSKNQVSVYFDTKRMKLKRSGLTLRVRSVDGRYVQTIKSDGVNLFERGEWEKEIKDSRPDLNYGETSPLEPLGLKKLRKRLRPLFETRVQRTTYPLRHKGSDIELAIDRGEIDAGGLTLPLCEAEFELKQGDRTLLFDVARNFAAAASAELATRSKAQRGFALLAGETAEIAKAEDIELTAEMSARAAFQSIASACLKQIIGNKPAILADRAEGIHQMRIGLRRLRAAISLFADLVSEAELRPIKAELKWLTNELGPAREFEVFLSQVVAPLKKRHARLAGMRSLSRDLEERREAARKRALAAICSKRFRALTLNVAGWLETGSWREPQDGKQREFCEEPIETAAQAQLKRRWKKIRKRGRQLAKLDPAARHKLRIDAKKLRYATEFYETVFDRRKQQKQRAAFLSALKDMQDCLGELNDIFMHEKLATGMANAPASRSPQRSRELFAAGLLAGREEARLKPLLTSAESAFQRFEKLKPYWR
jgi:inorganic triphosphatase YgiF